MQNFEEYMTELQEELKTFSKWWHAMAKLNPKHFPMDMEKGEWDEQFRCWQADPSDKTFKIPEED